LVGDEFLRQARAGMVGERGGAGEPGSVAALASAPLHSGVAARASFLSGALEQVVQLMHGRR
jgi:hypothetical protein